MLRKWLINCLLFDALFLRNCIKASQENTAENTTVVFSWHVFHFNKFASELYKWLYFMCSHTFLIERSRISTWQSRDITKKGPWNMTTEITKVQGYPLYILRSFSSKEIKIFLYLKSAGNKYYCNGNVDYYASINVN